MAKKVEDIILEYLPSDKGLQRTVAEAMNYSVLVGGKRIRPTMMREAYKLFGGEDQEIEPFMAAIEMIHSYSLVHDDLPCMDNDELRRGKPTTWKHYGEAMAVLAGDGLLTMAFETAAKAFSLSENPDRVGRCMGILASKAGLFGMLGGQSVDVEMTGKPLTRKQLMFIYKLKTGALLEACLMIGAVLAGADEEQVQTMERIASDIGTAFQIRDDVLDVISSEEELGKPIGSDEDNNKTTYVTFEGLEGADLEVHRLSENALELLATLPGDKGFFNSFVRKLEKRRN
ncbi:MAG: polyprenyl synthetase family protein [Lachnospiraceae bacterium]|nr:polyprenyl synthetase family protein [Lachnospiraceae bacterium]